MKNVKKSKKKKKKNTSNTKMQSNLQCFENSF